MPIEYYPTPANIIAKLFSGVGFDYRTSILEPSAGKGHIAKWVREKQKSRYSGYNKSGISFDIDTIEIDKEFRHILKGEGFRVVHDDFLTYETEKKYDIIAMNPPFSEGDKHLLKALNMQKDGGIVLCILNAETIRHPYSNIRKKLARLLEKYEAEMEFVSNAFWDSEHKTDVEIAIIKTRIPSSAGESIIIDNLKRGRTHYGEYQEQQRITSGDLFTGIVERYNYEVAAVTALINEYNSLMPFLSNDINGDSNLKILTLVTNKEDYYSTFNRFDTINHVLSDIRHKYWKTFFQSEKISKLMTSNLRNKYYDMLNDLRGYDVTLFNIYELMDSINLNMIQGVEECIIGLFDELTSRHSYNEYSKNIHYFDGWSTNKAWYINKKVILPLSAFSEWRQTCSYEPDSYRVIEKLEDIEKALNYLDAGRTDNINIKNAMAEAKENGETSKIELKFFTVTFYKKGTTHIEFTDLELLKKFNIFGCQQKKWLPPSYGKASYSTMSKAEKTVIDSFEGKEEYEKVYINPDFYLFSASQIPLLEMNAG